MRVVFVSSAVAVLRGTVQFTMEPELVANLLSDVEHAWVEAAATQDGLNKMKDSCEKVTESIVQGSDGNRERVEEYMGTVCDQKAFGSWEKVLCKKFATGINDFMRSDDEYNRDYLQPAKFCKSFYEVVQGTAAVEEKRREALRIKALEEAAKKKKDDEAKAKAAAELKKKREQEAAKKRELEEKKKKEEAAKKKKEEENKKIRAAKAKSSEESVKKAKAEMEKAKQLVAHSKAVTQKDTKKAPAVAPKSVAPKETAPKGVAPKEVAPKAVAPKGVAPKAPAAELKPQAKPVKLATKPETKPKAPEAKGKAKFLKH